MALFVSFRAMKTYKVSVAVILVVQIRHIRWPHVSSRLSNLIIEISAKITVRNNEVSV